MVRGAADRASIYPAWQARSERLHRTLQPNVSQRGARRLCVRLDRAGSRSDRELATRIQRRAAARQPRACASADVHAEAKTAGGVQLSAVSLTGELTAAPNFLESPEGASGGP